MGNGRHIKSITFCYTFNVAFIKKINKKCKNLIITHREICVNS